MTYQTIW